MTNNPIPPEDSHESQPPSEDGLHCPEDAREDSSSDTHDEPSGSPGETLPDDSDPMKTLADMPERGGLSDEALKTFVDAWGVEFDENVESGMTIKAREDNDEPIPGDLVEEFGESDEAAFSATGEPAETLVDFDLHSEPSTDNAEKSAEEFTADKTIMMDDEESGEDPATILADISGTQQPADADATFVMDDDQPVSATDADATFMMDGGMPPQSADADATFVMDEDGSLNEDDGMGKDGSVGVTDATVASDHFGTGASDDFQLNINVDITRVSDTADSQTGSKTAASNFSGADQAAPEGVVIKPRLFLSQETLQFGQADYEVLGKLGEGGMGVVYDARQTSIDRSVAVKMLKPPKGAGRKTQQRIVSLKSKFISEAIVTGDLEHPNIVPIYDLGTNEQGAVFYAMKHVNGTPWDDVIGNKSLFENLEIFMKVCDAVAYAHARGIIHRDLKPENVMLGGYGEVLVMDWGLALATEKFGKPSILKQKPGIGGTPAYMAPEMASGSLTGIGIESDVYLLGAILYEIVTGKPPHAGKDAMKCLMAAANNEIQPTGKTGELIDIALKAMETDVQDRYPTVQNLQEAIRDYQSHSESIAMANRANDDLAKARQTDDYTDYSRAVFGYQEAFDLWNENERARKGVSTAKLAYAESALRKSDFDLGLSLLDEGDAHHANVRTQLQEAKQERDARQQRLKTAKRIGFMMAAAILLIVSGAAYWINIERNEAIAQRQIAETAEKDARQQRDEAIRQKGIAEEQTRKTVLAGHESDFQRMIAELQSEIADEERAVADREREVAENQRQIAEQQRAIADAERDNAVVQEYVAIVEGQIADEERQRAEYKAYMARIGLAAAKIEENAFGTARELLAETNPKLRSWEWARLMYLCSRSSAEYTVNSKVNAIDLAPTGMHFVMVGENGLAEIWDRGTGQRQSQLPHSQNATIHCTAYSPNGKWIATGSDDSTAYLQLFDATTGNLIRAFQTRGGTAFEDEHTDAVLSVTFSPDGRTLLTSSADKTARLWNVETGKQAHRLQGHFSDVNDVGFSPDNNQLLTAGQDGTVIVWTRANGDWSSSNATIQQGEPFRGHDGAVYSATFSADGDSVISGGYDRTIRIWKPGEIQSFDYTRAINGLPQDEPPTRILVGHKARIRSVELSSDGRFVVSSSHDNTLKVWNVANGQIYKTIRGHDSWVTDAMFTRDDAWILSSSHDNRVKLWNFASYEEERILEDRVLEGHADAVLAVSFSKDGESVLTAGADRKAKQWGVDAPMQTALDSGSNDTPSIDDDTSYEEGHAFLISSARFFPDGRRIATASADNTTRIWNTETGTELLALQNTGRSAAISVSRGGQLILTGGGKQNDKRQGEDEITFWEAQLFNADTGEKLATLLAHRSEVTTTAISPDGTILFTGDATGRCRLWNSQSGQMIRELKIAELGRAHAGRITGAEFTSDGSRILTASRDFTVAQWDTATGNMLKDLTLQHDDAVTSIVLAGKRLLSTCDDGRVRAWNIDTVQVETTLKTPPLVEGGMPTQYVAFSPANPKQALTVNSEMKTVRLWDVDSGEEVQFQGHSFLDFGSHPIWAAVISPDGKSVVTVGGRVARLWDVRTRTIKDSYSAHGSVDMAVFDPAGKRVITASNDWLVKIWNAETGKAMLKLSHPAPVTSASFSPDAEGKQILTSAVDGKLRLWNSFTGELQQEFEGHQGEVRQAVFSNNGRWLLSAGEDQTARIWNRQTGKNVAVLRGHEGRVLCVAFSEDAQLIITGSEDNSAKIWRFHPDFEDPAGIVRELLVLRGHTAAVRSVAFSPDGRRALTGSDDYLVKLWDTSSPDEGITEGAQPDGPAADSETEVSASPLAQEVLTLKGHEREVTSVQFSPEGRFALTGSRDGKAILWLALNPATKE